MNQSKHWQLIITENYSCIIFSAFRFFFPGLALADILRFNIFILWKNSILTNKTTDLVKVSLTQDASCCTDVNKTSIRTKHNSHKVLITRGPNITLSILVFSQSLSSGPPNWLIRLCSFHFSFSHRTPSHFLFHLEEEGFLFCIQTMTSIFKYQKQYMKPRGSQYLLLCSKCAKTGLRASAI